MQPLADVAYPVHADGVPGHAELIERFVGPSTGFLWPTGCGLHRGQVAEEVRSARKVKRGPWSVEEARKFLEAASAARDPLYTAYVLILVLGFRRGEVLGLT